MVRAAEVVALRALGLSLAQVARALGGEPEALQTPLAAMGGSWPSPLQRVASFQRFEISWLVC
jgi:hypothetical protein